MNEEAEGRASVNEVRTGLLDEATEQIATLKREREEALRKLDEGLQVSGALQVKYLKDSLRERSARQAAEIERRLDNEHAAAGYWRQSGCDAYKQSPETAYSHCSCPKLPVLEAAEKERDALRERPLYYECSACNQKQRAAEERSKRLEEALRGALDDPLLFMRVSQRAPLEAVLSEEKGPAKRVAVGGNTMERSIADFVRACEVLMAEEQERASPQTHLIGVLADAVRLTRELERSVKAPTVPNDGTCPACRALGLFGGCDHCQHGIYVGGLCSACSQEHAGAPPKAQDSGDSSAGSKPKP